MDTLLAVDGIENLGAAARRELVNLSARQQLNPDHMVAVFEYETGGSMDPAQPNLAGSGAIGLIQFMPDTAAALGTSSTELAAMSQVEQLAYVEQYFAPAKGKIVTLSDHYLAVFAPKGIGQGEDFALYSSPSEEYLKNAPMDTDLDGIITVADATAPVHQIAQRAALRPRVPVDKAPPIGVNTVLKDTIGESGLAMLGMGLFIVALARWKRNTRLAVRM